MQAGTQHDISDKVWKTLKSLSFRRKRPYWVGLLWTTDSSSIAVFGILRTGTPWQDLPSCYGHWSSPHMALCGIIKGHEWDNSGIT